jgi:hypothetical protein
VRIYALAIWINISTAEARAENLKSPLCWEDWIGRRRTAALLELAPRRSVGPRPRVGHRWLEWSMVVDRWWTGGQTIACQTASAAAVDRAAAGDAT